MCKCLLELVFDQSEVMRAQQHASVWPIVNSDVTINQNDTQNFIEFKVANVGVGPAIIKHTKLYVNDSIIREFSGFQERILVGKLKTSISIEFASFNGILGAGESRTALKMWWPRSNENDSDFVKMVEQFVASDTSIKIEQCYCSVFDRCYVSSTSDVQGPVEVAHCPTGFSDPVQLVKETMHKPVALPESTK